MVLDAAFRFKYMVSSQMHKKCCFFLLMVLYCVCSGFFFKLLGLLGCFFVFCFLKFFNAYTMQNNAKSMCKRASRFQSKYLYFLTKR